MMEEKLFYMTANEPSLFNRLSSVLKRFTASKRSFQKSANVLAVWFLGILSNKGIIKRRYIWDVWH